MNWTLANLKDILYGVRLTSIEGNRDVAITGIYFDSRLVRPGGLFVAIKGLTVDGHDFLDKAITNGAAALVIEKLPEDKKQGLTYVMTENSAQALGVIASNYYGNPSSRLKLIGITGTNGKTTCATLLHQLFQKLGYRTGLISTVENKIGEETVPAQYTTPDAIELNALLADMVNGGCSHAFMEVSSHALVQHRVSGLQFAGGAFTNISHDHLDYHSTFDEYIRAKKILFDQLPAEAFALVNQDDKRGRIMLQNCRASRYTFGIKGMADYKARVLHNTLQGLELDVDDTVAWFRLIGGFNAYNLLMVYAISRLLEESKEDILMHMSTLQGARGRFEYVQNKSQVLAIVDYAHTPDALQNVLSTIDNLRSRNEQLVTVVGCGGDRDVDKRPKMARIALDLSDKVILTSDNPRTEDPEQILDDMMSGIPKSGIRQTLRITDRKEAIRAACNMVGASDIILVAGKGHETYQEMNGQRRHFDDKEILIEMLNEV